MSRRLIAVVLLASLQGCASFNGAARAAAGDGQVSDYVSDFSGRRVVEMSPAFVPAASGTFASCCKVGVEWYPEVPQIVVLNVGVRGTVGIKSVSVNLDGNILQLEPVEDITQFRTRNSDDWSFKAYALARSALERIPVAEPAKILVATFSDGSIAGDLKRGDGGMFIDFLPAYLTAMAGTSKKPP